METILRLAKRLIPKKLFSALQPAYHYLLALAGAVRYRFPSRKIGVIGVTGTKGKSSVVEITAAVLEEAGFKVASASTVRFKLAGEVRPNLLKMTMPGRFFLQKFLREAVSAGCDWAVMEMSSEGAKLYRHKFIDLDALIMTNISPEHIESHGSYENYLAAKLRLVRSLENSPKKNKYIIANADDREGHRFLDVRGPAKLPYRLADGEPYSLSPTGATFTFKGVTISTRLPGVFSIYNMLAAATLADALGVPPEKIKTALEKFEGVAGRAQKVFASGELKAKQPFDVVVDYAHTAESLKSIYEAYPGRRICVLGGTGGGRDTWKRPLMGRIAAEHCDRIFFTDEDPYDEDPLKIVRETAADVPKDKYEIIMDRRQAIRRALETARAGDTVLLTGKGTDPCIMGPNGTKTPWSDARVAQEELDKLLSNA